MATIIDPEELKREATVLEESEEYNSLDETEVSEEPEVPEPEDDLPEKYKGKSASDIARMHQELEKRLGQQSQEVGQLRQAFDDYIKSSVTQQAQANVTPEPEPEDDLDWYTDPAGATNKAAQRALQNSPEMQQLRAIAVEMKKNESLSRLQKAHPDMNSIVTDESFREWVGKSPIRQQLFAQADQQYDFDAANELLSLYKERKGVVEQTKQVEKVAKQNEVKKASTGSARTNPNGTTSKKIYRRTDVIELMKTNPKRYNDLLPELMVAYQEGRVR